MLLKPHKLFLFILNLCLLSLLTPQLILADGDSKDDDTPKDSIVVTPGRPTLSHEYLHHKRALKIG